MLVNFWGELIYVAGVFSYVCRLYFPVFQREFNTTRIYDFNEKREKKHCVKLKPYTSKWFYSIQINHL